MDEDAIIEAVHNVHEVMSKNHKALGGHFLTFPRGCCGDASQLLAANLTDKGLGTFALESGCRREGDKFQSYAWLKKEDLIIDVSAVILPIRH